LPAVDAAELQHGIVGRRLLIGVASGGFGDAEEEASLDTDLLSDLNRRDERDLWLPGRRTAGFGLEAMTDAPRFERLTTETIGGDLLTTFRARE